MNLRLISGISISNAILFAFVVFSFSAEAQPVKSANSRGGARSVSVKTEAKATIWIDGVKYGKTGDDGRLNVSTVSPGKHAIRVRADGFKETVKSLLATQKGEIEIPLTRTSDESEIALQQAEVLSVSDREKAAEAYSKAIRLRPGYVEAFIGLARVYSESGQREKAEKAIRDLRKIRPGYPEASAIEGRILKEGGDDPKAIAAFKRAIAEGKGFQPEAYTGLGLLYKEKAETFAGAGDYEQESANYAEAAKYLRVAAKQLGSSPDAIVVYQLLGLVYEQQKKPREAIAVYEEFLRVFPDIPESEAVQSFIIQLKKQMNEPK